MAHERQICTFLLGHQLCGLPVERVQEVLRPQRMTRMPLAPAAVRGLLNLRGQVVVAIDLRPRFGLPPTPSPTSCKNVVVRGVDGPASLLVDEVGDVVTVGDLQRESPPEMMGDALRGLVTGVYKLRDRVVVLLDAEAAISV